MGRCFFLIPESWVFWCFLVFFFFSFGRFVLFFFWRLKEASWWFFFGVWMIFQNSCERQVLFSFLSSLSLRRDFFFKALSWFCIFGEFFFFSLLQGLSGIVLNICLGFWLRQIQVIKKNSSANINRWNNQPTSLFRIFFAAKNLWHSPANNEGTDLGKKDFHG